MIKEKKLSVRLGLLAGLISLGLLGSTAGSLAWYAYSRTVTMSFVGTTVSSSALLNVGLVDNDGVFTTEDLTTYGLERDDTSDPAKSIVWAKSRSGFSLLALRHYLDNTVYATDLLKPVTTRSRLYNDSTEFKLYRSPEYSETTFEDEANPDNYVVLPFAFRVKNENDELMPNRNIWLTESVVSAEENAESSIRVYFEGENDFLMQPSMEIDPDGDNIGYTKVGGVLSLAPGDYFDFDNSNKEYCYGEFENEVQYSTLSSGEYDVLDNINHVPSEFTTEANTFYGKHRDGALVPDIDAAVPKTQEYIGIGRVKPLVSSSGQFTSDATHGLAVAKTDSTTSVGYTTVTIFVEGWDYNVIDQKAGYSFNLGLKFEIDRL